MSLIPEIALRGKGGWLVLDAGAGFASDAGINGDDTTGANLHMVEIGYRLHGMNWRQCLCGSGRVQTSRLRQKSVDLRGPHRHQFAGMMMTNSKVTTPTREPDPARDERPSAPATASVHPTELSSDAIDGAELLRILEGDPHLLTDLEAAANAPRVKRMPEGIEVRERQVGLAAGQWVLRVRCQCGRSWFELEEIHWATCPRCSLLVRVNIDAKQG